MLRHYFPTLLCRCSAAVSLCKFNAVLARHHPDAFTHPAPLARLVNMPHAPAGGDYAGKRLGRRRVQGVGQRTERCGSSHGDERWRRWRWRRHDRHRYRDRPDTVRMSMGSSIVALIVQRCLVLSVSFPCSNVLKLFIVRCLFTRFVTSSEILDFSVVG